MLEIEINIVQEDKIEHIYYEVENQSYYDKIIEKLDINFFELRTSVDEILLNSNIKGNIRVYLNEKIGNKRVHRSIGGPPIYKFDQRILDTIKASFSETEQ